MTKRRRSSESDAHILLEDDDFQAKKIYPGIKSFMAIMHPDVIQLIHVCLRPENDDKMEFLLQDFYDKFSDSFMHEEVEGVDIFCKFALAFLYEQNCPTDSVVSRILYAYVKKTGSCSTLDLNELEYQNEFQITDTDNFLTAVSSFTLPVEQWTVKLLSLILFRVLESGQLGFLHFLIKYGLNIYLPIEDHLMIKYLTRNLLNWKIEKLTDAAENQQITLEWDTTTAEDLDGKLTQIRLNEEMNYTRTLLTLCTINIVKEFQTSKKYELKVAEERCHCKLQCLKLYTETTTEPFIAFKDIENFLVVFFGPQHKDLLLQSLKNSLEELDPETPTYCQPRTLQDLARSKIRDSLTYSGVLPDKLSKLHLPNRLKKFILFHETDIWEFLKADAKFAKLQHYIEYFMQTRDDL